MSVRVYVEGGGDSDRTRTACRKGFSDLVKKVLKDSPKPRIVVCGGRNEAFKSIALAMDDPQSTSLLLVDSEQRVKSGATASDHLRGHDHWSAPASANEDQIHLMVGAMETWLIADPKALVSYYGKGFRGDALPPNPNVEEIPKRDVMRSLQAATGQTSKQSYHKIEDGLQILSLLDINVVRSKSPFAGRFFAALTHYSSTS